MKNLILFTLSTFCIIHISCNQDPLLPEDDNYWGTAYLLKDGQTWKVSPYASVHLGFQEGNRVNIGFDSIGVSGFAVEACLLLKVPSVPGTYPIVHTSVQDKDSLVGAAYVYTNVDVVYGFYEISEADTSSFVTITSYDSISTEITGNFEVIFLPLHKPFADAPDTIICSGLFHTKID